MKKTLMISCVLLTVMITSSCTGEIKIGTGDIGGTYYKYGTALTQIVEESNTDMNLRVRETAGSAANLRLMQDGYLNIAFTQIDTALDAYNGSGTFENKYDDFTAIAGLYTEAVQIVTDADSDIMTASDLYGKRVSLGETDSGVINNARQILSAYGLSEENIEPYYLSFTDAAKELQDGNIDAFFCTSGVPTSAVAELARIGEIKLVPIDGDIAERIIEQYKTYIPYTIDAGTYKYVGETQTLGIKTVLVADNDLSSDDVYKITKSLFENGDKLMFAVAGDTDADINSATQSIAIPFHEGAKKYYAEQGIKIKDTEDK